MYETVVPPLDERDFEKTVTPIVKEYFEHGDANEVAVSASPLCRKQAFSKHGSLSQTVLCVNLSVILSSQMLTLRLLSIPRSCLQSSIWGPCEVKSPRWLCRWPWRPKPVTGSSPPGCFLTCVGLFCLTTTWKTHLTNCSKSYPTWSWTHPEPHR